MHEPIKDRVGQGRLPEGGMPLLDGQLAGHEGGAAPVPLVEDLQEIAPGVVGQGREAPVVQHEEIEFGEATEDLAVAAVALGHRKVPEEPHEPEGLGREAEATGQVGERRGHIGFADAGGPAEQHIVMLAEPLARGQRGDQRFVVSADAISPKIAELKSPLNTESQCPFTDHPDGGGTDAAKGGLYGDSGIGPARAVSL
jgi:hypothetical protein